MPNENHEPGNAGHEAVYGRRVEMDRSWTVYDVFTGVPAAAAYGEMTGLSRADATERVACLNRRAEAKRIVRAAPSPCMAR